MHPKDLRYTRTHEWVRLEGDTATVGITDHAQSELGDVVYVELPSVGAKVTKGSPFGTVESVKTVSELVSPVSGEVTKVNQDLPDAPERINDNPYGNGWMLEVRLSDPTEVDALMSADEYEQFIQEQ